MSLKKIVFRLAAAACVGFGVAVVYAASGDTVEERTAPVGDVCMAGEACAAAVAAASGGEPRSGKDVYDSKCASCHATGAAGAPKMGDAGAWESRIAKGMDTLYEHAWSGFNAMPAKGLCMDCSREEIEAAVDHILENTQ